MFILVNLMSKNIHRYDLQTTIVVILEVTRRVHGVMQRRMDRKNIAKCWNVRRICIHICGIQILVAMAMMRKHDLTRYDDDVRYYLRFLECFNWTLI
jgi:hypothetical protein